MKKCGFIAILGRPNVGKSTLLNHILNYKISITCRKPQTTRHQITGIKTTDNVQYIYVDTPGIQSQISRKLNKLMNLAAISTMNDVDVILFVVEIGKWTDLDNWILEKLKTTNTPVILVVNKVDQKKPAQSAMQFAKEISMMHDFKDVCIVSAKQRHHLDILEKSIKNYLTDSEHFFYAEDQITDKTERFLIAETIREKLMRSLGQEVPHQVAVEIEAANIDRDAKKAEIHALILVERDGQKGIIIGAKGIKLKKIRVDATTDIVKIIGMPVTLKLWVKVKKKLV